MDIVALIGGLLLILVGANALTDGAASVAKRFNISSLVIGLTIVAFGTSAPELTVSIVSALKGSADMAIGNVVGSNIFNTLMIVGCTAAIVPIGMTKGRSAKRFRWCILASVVLFICGNDVLINRCCTKHHQQQRRYAVAMFLRDSSSVTRLPLPAMGTAKAKQR